MKNDFFIGWQSAENLRISSHVKLFVGLLFFGTILSGFMIAKSEKGFSNSTFEYGQLSEMIGTYYSWPYPILVYDDNGERRSVLLFDFGKFGAQNSISAYENKHGFSLNGRNIKVSGTKIFRNEAYALELSEGIHSIIGTNRSPPRISTEKTTLGEKTLLGEIADPKCFLGVMKPGFAKPHRSCAVRCISGGIPPMLRQISADGSEDYYIITGPGGIPINQDILEYVADEVRLCGPTYLINGWKTIEVDPSQGIQRLRRHWEMSDVIMCSK